MNMDSDPQYTSFLLKQVETAKEAQKINLSSPRPRPQKDRLRTFLHYSNNGEKEKLEKDCVQMCTSFITGTTHSSKKSLEDLKPINLNQMMIPKLHLGFYLVCRTISKGKTIVGTMVLVEDQNGDIEELSLYNFRRSNESTENFLPTGTVMIIKEPYMKFGSLGKNTCIRVDSPSDVIFLDETDDFLRTFGWRMSFNASFEYNKSKGNEYFKMKDYEKSVKLYNRALKAEDNPIIYLNRSAAYLQLNKYFEAYKDAKKAYEMNANIEKALYRLGKSAYGMRDWNKALEHYQKFVDLYPDNQDIKKEIDKCKKRLNESLTGDYDLQSLYQKSMDSVVNIDVADYVGPVEIIDTKGKGKGVAASRDIVRGTLLLVSKAFSFSMRNMTDTNNNNINEIDKKLVFCINLITNKADKDTQGVNLVETVQNLKCNPQRAKELYSLYAGDLDRNNKIDSGVIDIERIEKICSFNSFEGIQVYEMLMVNKDSKKKSTGLWLYPSFINHSCLSNTFHLFYGDIMMVYAIKDLKKGEEITLSYLDPFETYEKRLEKMKCYKFTCNCELCVLDRADVFNDRRNEIFKKEYENLKCLMHSQNSESIMKAFQAAKAFVDKLRKSYTKRNSYQLHLHLAISLLANLYQASGDYIKASILFNEATEICGDTLGHIGFHTQLKAVECYKQSKKIEFAKNALKKAFESNKIRTGADKTLFKVIFGDILKKYDIYDLMNDKIIYS